MSPNIKRDNTLRKMFSWTVRADPKGTKKPQPVVVPKTIPEKLDVPEQKKEKKKRKKRKVRKVSQLRSSPRGEEVEDQGGTVQMMILSWVPLQTSVHRSEELQQFQD